MKVKIGPYTNWFGPYQLAEVLCFWVKDVKDEYGIPRKPDWVHEFGEFLAHGFSPDESDKPRSLRKHKERPETWLYKLLSWIDSKKKRKISVHIDRWDTWSMDSTLGYIILPMLKQLRDSKHGSQLVDLEDVPPELRYDNPNDRAEWEPGQLDLDLWPDSVGTVGNEELPNIHSRWDWVLGEMIWAFEQLNSDWEDQYHTGESDWFWEATEVDENGKPKMFRMHKGPNDTSHFDAEGHKKHSERMDNGFRLFGKYYRGLWD